jgi:MFS family permease
MAASSDDRYKWVALANTTAAMFMATLDGSIVIIALPAIFRGIGLDPLLPGSIFYLLWMIMGYRLVQAVLVVSLGRLGDMYGRVKIYNAGFVVFTFASILLSFDPFRAGGEAPPSWAACRPGTGVRRRVCGPPSRTRARRCRSVCSSR